MTRALVFDADIFVYRSAAKSDETILWTDGGMATRHANLNTAKAHLDSSIASLTEELEGDQVLLALSDPASNHRHNYLPSYKNNRIGSERPLVRRHLEDYLLDEYGDACYRREGLEGDDVVGILLTHPTLVKASEKIHVGLDKDLYTIPGSHLRVDEAAWQQNLLGGTLLDYVKWVSPEEAAAWFQVMAFAGDATDGFGGCPGIGFKKATELLHETDPHIVIPEPSRNGKIRWVKVFDDRVDWWSTVLSYYHKAGLTDTMPDWYDSGDEYVKAYALAQARCARILHAIDYDFKTKQVIPWTPPEPTFMTGEEDDE